MSLHNTNQSLLAMSALCKQQEALLNVLIEGVSNLQLRINELNLGETNQQNNNKSPIGDKAQKQERLAKKAWQKILKSQIALKTANNIFGKSIIKFAQCKSQNVITDWRVEQSHSSASREQFDKNTLRLRATEQLFAKCKQQLRESASLLEERTAEAGKITADTIYLQNEYMGLATINTVLSQKIRQDRLELERVEREIEEGRDQLVRGRYKLTGESSFGGDYPRFLEIKEKLLGDMTFLKKMCQEGVGQINGKQRSETNELFLKESFS